CERREIRHGRRLAAIERTLDGVTPTTGFEIDEVGHIASGDAQSERVTLDRGAVEELIVGPHRRHGRKLVDRYLGWRRVAEHRDQPDGGIVFASSVGSRFATCSDKVKAAVFAWRLFGGNLELTVGIGLDLS